MNSLIEKWGAEQCPMLNGITVANGAHHPVKPIDAPRTQLPLRLGYSQAHPLPDTALLQWASVNLLCESQSLPLRLKIKAGEGSMGSDGVIALFDEADHLQWIAFFDFSNPFERVRFEGETVVAENNLGEKWRLPIEQPWAVTIEAT